MNKRYIDFVPTRSKETPMPAKRPIARKVMDREVVYQDTEVLIDDAGIGVMEETFSIQQEPSLGVVEDFQPKFVKTEVPKRPLGQRHFEQKKSEVVEAKSKKIKVKAAMREPSRATKPTAGKSVQPKAQLSARSRTQSSTQSKVQSSAQSKAQAKVQAKNQSTYKVPKSPFINQGKVAKRPLSKNVYQKSVKPTKQKASGPVTIIAKPEKDAHASMVVTIILTIIVGAAAGTIAFLLLPK